MQANKTTSNSEDSEEILMKEFLIRFKSLVNFFQTKWFVFLISVVIGGISGICFYYLQQPEYTSECTFILEEKSSGTNGLAGLASQFGLDLSGGGGGSLFAGDNLLEILPSKKIVQKVLLSKVDSTSNKTLADLFLDFSGLKKSWAKNDKLKDIGYQNVNYNNSLTLPQDSILNIVYQYVVKSNLKIDWARKKASIIKVSVTSKSEKFSKFLTERVVEASKELYIEIKTGTSQANVNRLQSKADSLLSFLNYKSYQTSQEQILNANIARKEALVPFEISTRDKTVAGSVYTEVVKNLETGKLLLSQQTPVIQILDQSEFPLTMIKKGKVYLLIAGTFLGFFIVFIYLTMMYSLNTFRKRQA